MAILRKKKRKLKAKDKVKEAWLKKLGLSIKELRLEHDMSQSDLAYSIKMDAQNISRLERGLTNSSAYLINQICITLGVSLADFYAPLEK